MLCLTPVTITGTGSLQAQSGGIIRPEAFTNTMSGSTNPVASRALAPRPLASPLTTTVSITTINGVTVPDPPQGGFGVVDVILPAPGVATFQVETSGVPSGTNVELTVKPRVDGAPTTGSTTLNPVNCDAAGNCLATIAFDLAAGAYVLEARATFETP